MGNLHIGVLGAGAIAREHAASFRHQPAINQLSVFDVETTRRDGFAADFGATARESAEALIEGCDLVWICTPPAFHREAIAQAVAAGTPIFCEKPLALDSEDVTAIEALVADSSVPFYMGQSGRWSEPFRKLQEAAAQGAIGEVVEVWSTRLGYLDPAVHPAWRFDDARSGGVVLELGVHELDFIRWVGGDWLDIHACGSSRTLNPGKFLDTASVVGRLASGAHATAELSWAEPRYLWQRGARGTEGSLFIDDMTFTNVELWRPGKAEPEIIEAENWQHPETKENMAFRRQLEAVVRAVDGEASFPVTVTDGAAAVRAALAIRQSIETNNSITL